METIDIFTREQAIAKIATTYPPDAHSPFVRRRAEQLLAQAQREAVAWRQLPDPVLFRLAELCQAEVERSEKLSERLREIGL